MARKGLKVDGNRVGRARINMPGSPSQHAFADQIGIHWVTQSRIETGKALVSLELLEKIAEATGTTREYLLGEDEDEEAAQVLSPDHVEMLDVLIAALTTARQKVAA